MFAYEKNDIVSYSSKYDHVIPANKTFTLEEYADEIEKVYDTSNKNRNALVCTWLRGTEGTIVRNRLGKTWLKFKKHID